MKKTYLFILIVLIFASCKEDTNRELSNSKSYTKIESSLDNVNNLDIEFIHPLNIDSTDWIIFPLTLKDIKDKKNLDRGGRFINEPDYYNIAFYNYKTKENRLLSDSLKMIVNSFNFNKKRNKNYSNDNFIHYLITCNDYNKDGNLDLDDPKYLFISDISGRNFKQITPSNYYVQKLEIITDDNILLIQGLKDINNNKKFEDNDKVIFFIYNFNENSLVKVFNEDFIKKSKNILSKQWNNSIKNDK